MPHPLFLVRSLGEAPTGRGSDSKGLRGVYDSQSYEGLRLGAVRPISWCVQGLSSSMDMQHWLFAASS